MALPEFLSGNMMLFTDILNGIIETVLNNPLPLCSNVSILDGYIIAFVPHDINSDTETALHISDFNFIFDDLANGIII